MVNEIYYGGFGTGKTAELFKRLKEAAERKERCILFVPEQFSFDTEREVYFYAGAKNIRYIKVTGFSKLSREMLNLYKAAKPCADNAVKLLTMWKTIENAKEDLISFGSDKALSSLCPLMLKTVSAFKNAGITPADYKKFLESERSLDENLSDKAGDFLRIYADYNKSLTENLDDILDDVSKAAMLAREHNYFKDCNLFFDNYDSFSTVQKKLLKVALEQCRQSIFCFTSDLPDSGKKEFLCVSKTINEILSIAPDTILKRFDSPFRSEKRDGEPISVFCAKTPYDEAEYIAAEIHRSVREDKSRYRDFLIITADSDYEDIVGDRLSDEGIPVFCDFPRRLTDMPLIGFVIDTLKALYLETEDIFALTESGFLRIKDNDENGNDVIRRVLGSEAFDLRCGAEKYGIGSEDWKNGFEDDARKELGKCEPLRKAIVEPLLSLKARLENSEDGADFSRIFTEYLLDEQKIQSAFIAQSKSDAGGEIHKIETDERAAEENGRIWDALCEALASMAYCLEGVKIDIKNYRLLLEEILSGINLANPPQVLDCVTLGDAERTRKAAPKTVIFVGFNEGTVPRRSNLESIFTDDEKEKLNALGLSIYDSKVNRSSKEHYFIQRALNLYEKNLIITYHCQSFEGKETFPSSILSTEKFKNLPHLSRDDFSLDFFINTPYDLRSALSSAMSENDGTKEKLEKLLEYSEDGEFSQKAADALSLLRAERRFFLLPETAKRLFENREYSPTYLENSFNCPFMFFAKNGLKLYEPDTADIEAANNNGTAIHRIICGALRKEPRMDKLEDSGIEALAEKITEEEADRAVKADPTFPERTRFSYRRMLPQIKNILKQIAFELKQGGFVPSDFEKQVSYTIRDERLDEFGGFVTIKGTADRIDYFKEKNETLVRVFDYKSGFTPKTFSLDEAEQGAALQMLLYLFAECGGSKKPGGIGYFSTGKPTLYSAPSSAEINAAEIEKAWYEGHPIKGAVFDGSGEPKKQNELYNKNVKEKVKSSPKTNDKYFSAEYLSSDKFDELRSHIEKDIIVKKILDIRSGKIGAVPLKNHDRLPCGHCVFKSICGNGENNAETVTRHSELDKYRHTDEAEKKEEK